MVSVDGCEMAKGDSATGTCNSPSNLSIMQELCSPLTITNTSVLSAAAAAAAIIIIGTAVVQQPARLPGYDIA